MPTLDVRSLSALGAYAEASYKVAPGWFVAARLGHVNFEDVPSPEGAVSWESDVTRVEVGVGYFLTRQILIKGSLQYNERARGRETKATLPSVQVIFWF